MKDRKGREKSDFFFEGRKIKKTKGKALFFEVDFSAPFFLISLDLDCGLLLPHLVAYKFCNHKSFFLLKIYLYLGKFQIRARVKHNKGPLN